MPRRCRIHFVSLRSSLVNLPISLYGPLVERGIRPQSLAVHLTLVSGSGAPKSALKRELYVGWTGMASASSLAHFNSGEAGDRGLETVEIDPQYAEGLGLALGDVVEIGLLHDLGYAKSVATEPATSDDWEILELHASHVESTLLSQVRVAVVGQEIDVWVLGRTRVRLNVVSLEPSAGKALLLTASTEVSIAPKVRSKTKGAKAGSDAKAAQKAAPLANGVNGDHAPSPEKKSVSGLSRTLRLLPKRMLVGAPQAHSVSDGPETPIAYVSYTTLAGLRPTQPPSSQLHAWRASIRRIPPPANPARESEPASAPSQRAPRVLIPNGEAGSSKASAAASTPPRNEVVVVWSPDVYVPDGHVSLQAGCDNAEDWDLIRISFVREESSRALPPYQAPTLPSPVQSTASSAYGLAGVDELFSKCTQYCLTSYANHAFSTRVRGVPGLLVTGRSGAGKTALLHAVSNAMEDDPRTLCFTLYVDLSRFSGSPVAKVRTHMKYWMEKAAWRKPSLLILDNIDKLMGTELEHADSFHTRHITELFLALFGSSSRSAAPNASGVVLLAAAESQAALHPLLNSSHIFKEVVHLKPPSKDARKEVLAHIVDEHMSSSDIIQDPAAPLNYTALATQTEGYSVTDLKDLVARAVHRAAIRSSQLDSSNADEAQQTTLTPTDFAAAQVDFVPHSLRDVKLQKSEVVWADIGGLQDTKRVLRETLEWPTKYGPIFAQSPLRLRSGLLLYGYPGCGKTLLASAVAKECGLNFISIKGPELLNKYIGASEKSVRDLFERASAAKPCVLFFDEFDSIAPKRGHDSTGVTDRVVNQMLTQMDGAEGLDGVYVLAATSRPDLIDSALLRPGRLDKSLLCDMPSLEDRIEILDALRRKVAIAPSVDLAELAHETEGFSGADLQALVYNAHLEVIHDTISAFPSSEGSTTAGTASGAEGTEPVKYTVLGGQSGDRRVLSRAEESAFQRRLQRIMTGASMDKDRGRAGPSSTASAPKPKARHEIGGEHLRRVLGVTRPSVPAEERERLRRIYSAFVADRSGEMPVPPEVGGIGNRASLA
ncbi:AAA-domain-containing protein [Trametes versicolor FP-101664 SS1]|uniref:AAA-domain-containing protein n=1 Tax=Trametes versicolor (strain FP-101664) TaxID=717944 RepID=UPI0004621C0D|nr:AAA-domain-containing protein [Trametes versicolor FP-101664 SS1]EIW52807.1 AAA-domain-containing protein [Trametes versicolor FP-101664 SS1]